MAMHTNLYYQFLAANVGKIKPSSRANKFTAVSGDKMKVFIALTYYMGIVKKQNIQTYWSTDDLLNTPFVRNTHVS